MAENKIRTRVQDIRSRLSAINALIEEKTRTLNAEREILRTEWGDLIKQCEHPGLKEDLERQRERHRRTGGCACSCECKDCGHEEDVLYDDGR